MDDARTQANEALMDEMAARVDDLQRRFEKLVEILREDNVCQRLGVPSAEFDRTLASTAPLDLRTMKHNNARFRLIRDLQRNAVVDRLSRVAPERLDELLRGS
jgi:hypothetical protein